MRAVANKGGTIVFGGPPCQGFSYSNLRTRSADNPENWLFMEFVRVVQVWQPDWVVFENVRGVVNTAGGILFDHVIDHLTKLGYTTTHGLLNAMDFGVPQDRAGSCCMAILPQPASGRTSPAGRGPTRHRLDDTSYFSVDSAYDSTSRLCGRIAGAPSSSNAAVRCLSSLSWRYSRASTRTLCVKILAATALT
jgi:hypothetical protein